MCHDNYSVQTCWIRNEKELYDDQIVAKDHRMDLLREIHFNQIDHCDMRSVISFKNIWKNKQSHGINGEYHSARCELSQSIFASHHRKINLQSY